MNLKQLLISLGAAGTITVAILLNHGVDPATITDVEIINEHSVRILTPEGKMINAGSPADVAANYPDLADKVEVKMIEWKEAQELKNKKDL